MFGKNPQLRQHLDRTKFLVKEIFHTIQGEGPHTGLPAIFIRLAGCNLACTYCDTDFETEGAVQWSTTDLVQYVKQEHNVQRCQLVVITGGEPFRQSAGWLAYQLIQQELQVQIETSGSLFDEDLELFRSANNGPEYLSIVCSPKTQKLHPKILPFITCYKYILEQGRISAEDGLPSMTTQSLDATLARIARPHNRNVPVYVHPCDMNGDGPYPCDQTRRNMMAAATSAMLHGYRLGVQVHKLAEVP